MLSDQLIALRQKLRYMGERVDQPSNISDNMSVILNLSILAPSLK